MLTYGELVERLNAANSIEEFFNGESVILADNITIKNKITDITIRTHLDDGYSLIFKYFRDYSYMKNLIANLNPANLGKRHYDRLSIERRGDNVVIIIDGYISFKTHDWSIINLPNEQLAEMILERLDEFSFNIIPHEEPNSYLNTEYYEITIRSYVFRTWTFCGLKDITAVYLLYDEMPNNPIRGIAKSAK